MKIASLHIFPIKGLRGISVARARITKRGLEHDRRYMLTTPDGRFISQRSHPALARLAVRMNVVSDLVTASCSITDPEGRTLHLPLIQEGGLSVKVDIWGDAVSALAGFVEANQFFSAYLGEEVQLVWMPPMADRPIDPDFSKPTDQVSFADGYPILVLGSASIEELNQRLTEPIPLNRFRANIIVSGARPWQEDEWTSLRASSVHLRLVKKCARCVVITIDQETGISGREPTATLATYRREGNNVMVGMNAIPEGREGEIMVGDKIMPAS
ncbi:MAG: MOSC domain-containing protein [Bacteroidetes bacterium]|nr:MOSC domain-containing protein [Bacteroidota bacterium]